MSWKNESYWKKHIQTFRTSGITAYKYCKKYGIVYSTFQRWEKKSKSDLVKPIAIQFPESRTTTPSSSVLIETKNMKITLPENAGYSTVINIIKELSRCS
jgi:hypothetical protein